MEVRCVGRLGLLILRDYLTHGGSLFVLGGKSAYGAGGLRDSGLEDLLPIEVSDSVFDIVRKRAAPIRALRPHPATADVNWAALPPEPLYLHRVTVRPNGETLLTAGSDPVLVVAELQGGGRIACLLAAPYGGQAGKVPALFAASDWPEFMRRLLAWLARRDTP